MTIGSLPERCGTKNELSTRLRVLIGPLTVILTLTTAIALLHHGDSDDAPPRDRSDRVDPALHPQCHGAGGR